MAWWTPIAKVSQAIQNGLTGIDSARIQVRGQQEINQQNIAWAKEAMDRDKALWYEQQQYNSPSAQMQRFREAGLNPNLIYGSGSVGGNVSSSAPPSRVPNLENPYKDYSIKTSFEPFVNILGAYMNYKLMDEQIDVQNETARNMSKDAINKDLQNQLLHEDLIQKKFGNSLLNSRYRMEYERFLRDTAFLDARTKNVIGQTGLIPYQQQALEIGVKKSQHEINNMFRVGREMDWKYKNMLPRELESLNTMIQGQKKSQRDQDYRYKFNMPLETKLLKQSSFGKSIENMYNDTYNEYGARYNSNIIEKMFGEAWMNLNRRSFQGDRRISKKFGFDEY